MGDRAVRRSECETYLAKAQTWSAKFATRVLHFMRELGDLMAADGQIKVWLDERQIAFAGNNADVLAWNRNDIPN